MRTGRLLIVPVAVMLVGAFLLVQNLVVVHAISRARARRPQPLTEPSMTPDTKNRCTNG